MSRDEPGHGYPQVMKVVMDQPWAILPGTLATIRELVQLRASGGRFSDEEIRARIGAGPAQRKPNRSGDVAVIPVYGVIMPKADLMMKMSGGTSIDSLRTAYLSAMQDPDIASIVLDVDSPGGSVDQVPEFAADMRAMRGRKPVLAVANTMMASAAYWLASQADEVAVSPSSLTGSIGVFAAHDDLSAAMEKLGVKTTLISAGKYKTEASDTMPLSEDARAHIQELVDSAYAMFTGDVAKGRRVPVADVRGGFGEGRVLPAKAAVAGGLADRVATLPQTIARAAQLAAEPTLGMRAESMAFISAESLAGVSLEAGAIGYTKTATTDAAWDGPAQKANLRNDGDGAYYRRAFAWVDSTADPAAKGSYKFIHHMVSAGGDIGAANTNGCSAGIAVLNGGRGGTTIPAGDRQGVYNHLAKHIRDAGREPPPLASLSMIEREARARGDASFVDEVEAVLCMADALVAKGRPLTAAKRERLSLLGERITSLCAQSPAVRATDARVAAMRMRTRLAELTHGSR